MREYLRPLGDEQLAGVIRRWVTAARWYGEQDGLRWVYARDSVVRAIADGYAEQASRLGRAQRQPALVPALEER